MKRLVVDLDGTLTDDYSAGSYADKHPNSPVIQKLREYKAAGFEIVIATSRNMRTYANTVGKINAFTLPVVLNLLQRHDVPYDAVHIGKPWCGDAGFYVDDKSIRPSEFQALTYEQIWALLERERGDKT